MTAAQVHRGPDAEGRYQGPRIVLDHRRLSILDLSEAGRQPMTNEDGSVHVVYNGEIYNYLELRDELLAAGHIFRSKSDTEVLAHGYEQWGIEGLLKRLRGMFAFAVYDSRAGLMLARDRLGIKPLYYFDGGDSLLFASEVKALMGSGHAPETPEPQALMGFLLAGSVPSPLTTVRGVRCLPPGHYLVCGDRGPAIHKYWDLDPASGSAASALRPLLEDAVSRHLVSDVPLGVFLSGGVDSAAIVALATRARARHEPPLTTLTVTFDDQEFNEAPQASTAAAHFATRHQSVRVTSAAFQREMPAFFRAMDQPTNDGLNTWFVSRAAREAGLTVVLSGLGGDEVFWGYPHYRLLARHAGWLGRCPASLRRLATGGLAATGRLRGRESWRRASYISREVTTGGLYLMFRGFFAPEQVASLLGASLSQVEDVAQEYFGAVAPPRLGPAAFNRLEIRRYLHDQLLRDTDAFSMAHSIETRVPFLDHPVLECAAGIPDDAKIDLRVNKPLLVDAVDDPLVRAAASRKKRGFSFPMDRWMKRSAGSLEEISRAASYLDRRAVQSLWRDFRGSRLHWSRAWSLAVLGASAG